MKLIDQDFSINPTTFAPRMVVSIEVYPEMFEDATCFRDNLNDAEVGAMFIDMLKEAATKVREARDRT